MKRSQAARRIVRPRKVDGFKQSSLGIALMLLLAGSAVAMTELDPTAVRAAAEYSARRRGVSLLAIQNGRTLLEKGAKTPHKIYSCSDELWYLAVLATAADRLVYM